MELPSVFVALDLTDVEAARLLARKLSGRVGSLSSASNFLPRMAPTEYGRCGFGFESISGSQVSRYAQYGRWRRSFRWRPAHRS